MRRRFHFTGFAPDPDLKNDCDLKLARAMHLAPFDARAIALLACNGDEFRCSIDIYSKDGAFIAESKRPTATEALADVFTSLTVKLIRWQERRQAHGTLPRRFESAPVISLHTDA